MKGKFSTMYAVYARIPSTETRQHYLALSLLEDLSYVRSEFSQFSLGNYLSSTSRNSHSNPRAP